MAEMVCQDSGFLVIGNRSRLVRQVLPMIPLRNGVTGGCFRHQLLVTQLKLACMVSSTKAQFPRTADVVAAPPRRD